MMDLERFTVESDDDDGLELVCPECGSDLYKEGMSLAAMVAGAMAHVCDPQTVAAMVEARRRAVQREENARAYVEAERARRDRLQAEENVQALREALGLD